MPSILACLEHRNATVRKNAVLAINSMMKLSRGEELLQDANDMIEKVSTPIPSSCHLSTPLPWTPAVLSARRPENRLSRSSDSRLYDGDIQYILQWSLDRTEGEAMSWMSS